MTEIVTDILMIKLQINPSVVDRTEADLNDSSQSIIRKGWG